MDVDAIVTEYSSSLRPKYRLLSSKTADLLTSILETNKIAPHSITFREKDPEKLREKISRESKNYSDPLSEVTDLAGVRIITYYPTDVDRILPLIKNEFEIDTHNSIDKRQATDPSSFGYASVHLVLNFRSDRIKLPEYASLKGLKCELQVRTILQHAWAEIEHDIAYKSTRDIPFELRRRFASLAGLLEIADREFEGLRAEQLSVRKSIQRQVSKDELDIELNLDSLSSYLAKYHNEKNFDSSRLSGLIHLLAEHDIHTLSFLNKALARETLHQADQHIAANKVQEMCPKKHQTCLLRYFWAIGQQFGLTQGQIAIAAGCHLLDPRNRQALLHGNIAKRTPLPAKPARIAKGQR
jgi:ppGpp synthetase/RelA/SpoT-type nucleotidyltranferase